MGLRNFVDMARTPEEKKEMVESYSSPASPSVPDYPYGLCLCLTHEEFEKLDIDPSCLEVGDVIHLAAFAKVTSMSVNARSDETGEHADCRVELQIVSLSMEDESTEEPGEDY